MKKSTGVLKRASRALSLIKEASLPEISTLTALTEKWQMFETKMHNLRKMKDGPLRWTPQEGRSDIPLFHPTPTELYMSRLGKSGNTQTEPITSPSNVDSTLEKKENDKTGENKKVDKKIKAEQMMRKKIDEMHYHKMDRNIREMSRRHEAKKPLVFPEDIGLGYADKEDIEIQKSPTENEPDSIRETANRDSDALIRKTPDRMELALEEMAERRKCKHSVMNPQKVHVKPFSTKTGRFVSRKMVELSLPRWSKNPNIDFIPKSHLRHFSPESWDSKRECSFQRNIDLKEVENKLNENSDKMTNCTLLSPSTLQENQGENNEQRIPNTYQYKPSEIELENTNNQYLSDTNQQRSSSRQTQNVNGQEQSKVTPNQIRMQQQSLMDQQDQIDKNQIELPNVNEQGLQNMYQEELSKVNPRELAHHESQHINPRKLSHIDSQKLTGNEIHKNNYHEEFTTYDPLKEPNLNSRELFVKKYPVFDTEIQYQPKLKENIDDQIVEVQYSKKRALETKEKLKVLSNLHRRAFPISFKKRATRRKYCAGV